jgi:hypothetical protein
MKGRSLEEAWRLIDMMVYKQEVKLSVVTVVDRGPATLGANSTQRSSPSMPFNILLHPSYHCLSMSAGTEITDRSCGCRSLGTVTVFANKVYRLFPEFAIASISIVLHRKNGL